MKIWSDLRWAHKHRNRVPGVRQPRWHISYVNIPTMSTYAPRNHGCRHFHSCPTKRQLNLTEQSNSGWLGYLKAHTGRGLCHQRNTQLKTRSPGRDRYGKIIWTGSLVQVWAHTEDEDMDGGLDHSRTHLAYASRRGISGNVDYSEY